MFRNCEVMSHIFVIMNCHQFSYFIHKQLITGYQIVDMCNHFEKCLLGIAFGKIESHHFEIIVHKWFTIQIIAHLEVVEFLNNYKINK